MSRHTIALSKAVARALRHEPWLCELEVDEHGWVDLEDLVSGMAGDPRWRGLTRADLVEMVGRSSKQRYEIAGMRIRALYGHSLPGRIAKTPGVPPELLGTGAASVVMILRDGLMPMRRQYVHLSIDKATAAAVGRRKSDRVAVLVVEAGVAHTRGIAFARGNKHVWLADHVPPDLIRVGPGG